MIQTDLLTRADTFSWNFSLYFFIRDFHRKIISKGKKVSALQKTFQMVFFEGGYRGKQKMKESQLIQNIRKYLATLPECFFWKEHGGQYGTAGIPDIIVCYKGRFIALEAKVGKNQPTRLQAATIDQIRRAGGIACVVRSVDEVKEILNNA